MVPEEASEWYVWLAAEIFFTHAHMPTQQVDRKEVTMSMFSYLYLDAGSWIIRGGERAASLAAREKGKGGLGLQWWSPELESGRGRLVLITGAGLDRAAEQETVAR